MKKFFDLPIRTKLFGLILLSSSTALLVAMVLIVTYDSVTYTDQRMRDLTTQAQIIGKISTAALAFNDSAAATDYLTALKPGPGIRAAALYNADGKLFAHYSIDDTRPSFPSVAPAGHRVTGDELELFYPIQKNSGIVGTVYLRSDLERLRRALNYASIMFVVMLAALAATLWISNTLQDTISAPILEIAGVANAVIRRKDYTLRAPTGSQDEIGSLTLAFNQMLDHIQERDRHLLAANASLKKEVEEREHAQYALKQNMQELARSNAELEQFAYVSSHDLQEPLRMVASYTQLLEKRYGDKFDEKGHVFLHYIIDGAKRMQQLIDDLLMFSRVGTRRKELKPVAVQGPLSAALLNLQQSIMESEARIDHGAMPTVLGDSTQLSQLFQNLIANAIKFCDEKPPHIEISAEKQDGLWLFKVKDHGIGIESDHFDRIFVVFQRLHGRTEYTGSGIGLAICKKIVELHGGRIWVESEPGQGSTFYFTLRDAP